MTRLLTHLATSALTLVAPVIGLALALAPAARALEWDKTEILQRANVGQPLPPYVFTCTNTGTAAVLIGELHPSCGCLMPSLAKRTLEPGESAKLTIIFDRTGYTGDVMRTFGVVTDEPGRVRNPYQLILRADLPGTLTITPRLNAWYKGEKAKPKSVDITVNLPHPVEIKGATSSDDTVTLKLVPVETGRRYRLEIKPRSTSKPFMTVITLQPAEPLPADTPLTIYAQVR